MISTKGRYSIRILLDLAEHRGVGYTPIKDVAARQSISLKYVEKLMPALKNAGLLDSSHGTVYCIEEDPVRYSNDPNGNPAQVISVDITWGELSFTYSDGTWNPDTHEYDGEGWTVDEEGGNSIKVENTGNTDVNVTYDYKAVENGITGSFTDGENPVSAPVALPVNGSSAVYLILAGKPEKELENAIIGSVTVTIGGESE